MSGELPWYIARASGLIAWALLTASVLWGLALSGRSMRTWAKPAWLLDLHRFLGGLCLIFVGVHIGGLLLDTYVHFGLGDILVPLAATWHPVAVAWGVATLYLLVAVELTSLLRNRMPRRWWRRTHYATLPLFVLATVHGFSAGTDRGNMAVIFVATAGIVAAGALLARRVARRHPGVTPAAGPQRQPLASKR